MEDETFDKLLDLQFQMQEKFYPGVQAMDREQQMLINTRAMVHETIEVENELNWKHWKLPVPVDWDKIKEELVDKFIFLMNQINICDMDAGELYEKTIAKIDINIERQKTKY